MVTDFGKLLAGVDPIVPPDHDEVVIGTVVRADSKMILVDIKGQFTGIITGMHMHAAIGSVEGINVGDTLESVVIGHDRISGLVNLSLKRAGQKKLLSKLAGNFDQKEILTVVPTEANKGGLMIDLDGIKGFIPVSQLTPEHYPRIEGGQSERILEHLKQFIGKPFKVRVLNVDEGGKKIIFSEKAAIAEQRASALEKLKVDDIVEGVVSGILTYGLFVTFNGGLEGLVHVSEIDWGHVPNASRFAKVGDHLKVKVIGVEGEKISLSVKQLRQNPWQMMADQFHVGDVIQAPVARISQFGIFVELHGGVSGLVHLSEVPEEILADLENNLHAGDIVEAKIITFDMAAKRIGLSMKKDVIDGTAEPNIAKQQRRRVPRKPKAEGAEGETTPASEEAPKAE